MTFQMAKSKSVVVAGLTGLCTLSLVCASAGTAAADGYRKKSRSHAHTAERYERDYDAPRRYRSPRYALENGTTGIIPSDIDLNAPGGPELLFEIIRRNSR